MNDLEKRLAKSGLDKNETIVYITILRHRRLSISEITTKTNIKRTSVYRFIDSLLKKDLLSKSIQGKKILYSAENPKNILKNINKKKENFIKILPVLTNLYDNNLNKPEIRFYENKKGLLKIYDEFGESFANVYGFLSVSKIMSIFNKKEFNEIDKLLTSKEKKSYDLIKNDKLGRQYMRDTKIEKNKYKKIKFLPKDFIIDVDILISGKKIAFISFDYLLGIVIENEQIADFQKNTHKFLWKDLK